ncbi:TPA: transposase, partial [Staphylococcus aureus]|nr:IS200/IS605 family transposase [Staphylococcus aureus]HAZ5366342.1 IS200/IS605 family transposase [Staphylococcus aureus]HDY9850993.1 transposase [Staphylococcus aureus]
DRHANLKYRYGNRKFWCKGFYVDTVGRNKKVIENYIRNQLQEDIVADWYVNIFLDSFHV